MPRPLARFVAHMYFCFIVVGVILLRGWINNAKALEFDPDIGGYDLDIPEISRTVVSKKTPEPKQDYKSLRAKEICGMAKAYNLDGQCPLLIAHLLKECGSMTEYCGWEPGKESNDNGWAFGIAQWHLWYRETDFSRSQGCWYKTRTDWKCDIPKLRDAWFKAHPELTDWRGQAKRYLTEMTANAAEYEEMGLSKEKAVLRVIDDWNADPGYVSAVKNNLKEAKELLSYADEGYYGKPHWIVIHDTDAEQDEQLSIIDAYHKRRGYPKSRQGYYVAYHYFIGRDGTVVHTRSDEGRSGHTSNQEINLDSVAIALAGAFNEQEPTDEQMKAAKKLIGELREKYSIPKDHVIPHREASATACPGKYLVDKFDSLL